MQVQMHICMHQPSPEPSAVYGRRAGSSSSTSYPFLNHMYSYTVQYVTGGQEAALPVGNDHCKMQMALSPVRPPGVSSLPKHTALRWHECEMFRAAGAWPWRLRNGDLPLPCTTLSCESIRPLEVAAAAGQLDCAVWLVEARPQGLQHACPLTCCMCLSALVAVVEGRRPNQSWLHLPSS